MEGSLSKWTNVMKGWQYRWFVLDENAGLLSYYTVSDVYTLYLLLPQNHDIFNNYPYVNKQTQVKYSKHAF